MTLFADTLSIAGRLPLLELQRAVRFVTEEGGRELFPHVHLRSAGATLEIVGRAGDRILVGEADLQDGDTFSSVVVRLAELQEALRSFGRQWPLVTLIAEQSTIVLTSEFGTKTIAVCNECDHHELLPARLAMANGEAAQ